MKFRTSLLRELSHGDGTYGIPASACDFNIKLPTYLRITDINDDGTLDFGNLKSLNDVNSNKYSLNENDIVFARTGASTGRNYFYKKSDGDFVYAGYLIKFSIDPAKIYPEYIKYFCQSQFYYDWVHSHTKGSTRGNINATTFGSLPITYPEEANYQKKIVKILAKISDKIELNKKINDNLSI